MSWKTGLMLLICDLLNLIQTFDGMKINLPLNKREKTKRLWITKTFCSTVKLKKSMKILQSLTVYLQSKPYAFTVQSMF